MSLSPRAMAVQGLGFAPRLVALQGFDEGASSNSSGGGGLVNSRWVPAFTPWANLPRRRPRKTRQQDLLFLGQ